MLIQSYFRCQSIKDISLTPILSFSFEPNNTLHHQRLAPTLKLLSVPLGTWLKTCDAGMAIVTVVSSTNLTLHYITIAIEDQTPFSP